MDWSSIGSWLDTTPLFVVGLLTLALMAAAYALGHALQPAPGEDARKSGDGQETFVVSAVLGLLALLIGFTFALAVDRFEGRRVLVLEEANAIGTAYLRTQLLAAPHRARLSSILTTYLDNRIALADPSADRVARLTQNDRLLVDLWAATAALFDDIKELGLSSDYLEPINGLIELDAARKTAYAARVPAEVFFVLLVFILVSSAVLGYVLTSRSPQVTGGLLLLLLVLVFTLMLDIDRPTAGLVNESQAPLMTLRASIAAEPPSVYDRWRSGST
jgi:hypothetical protein